VFGVGAAAILFVPWHCISCCGKGFCAVALCFVPWQCYSCHDHVLCAATLYLCHSVVLCAAMLFFVLQQENEVPWHCGHHSLSRGKKQHATALHSISCHCFFVPWQETTHCCIPWHVASCHSIVLCAMAKFVMPWLCFFVPQQETMCCSI